MGNSATLIADLTEARRLIKEVGWVQKHAAIDAEANRVAPWDASASSFCLSGAVQRACGMTSEFANNRYLDTICAIHRCIKIKIISFNDARGRTKEEVIEALDKTIEYVSKKPK